MPLILIVLLIVLLAGGGYGYSANWGGSQFGGLLGLILVILLILWLAGGVNLGHMNLR